MTARERAHALRVELTSGRVVLTDADYEAVLERAILAAQRDTIERCAQACDDKGAYCAARVVRALKPEDVKP